MNLPQGYHISYGGAYQEQQQSFSELLIILLSATLLVFTVMIFMFKDIKVALLIITISIFGNFWKHDCSFHNRNTAERGQLHRNHHDYRNPLARMQFLPFYNSTKTLETSSPDESVVYAISTRLRPKLMTAIGAIIALSPIALGIGTGAQLHQPLAIAVHWWICDCFAFAADCLSVDVETTV